MGAARLSPTPSGPMVCTAALFPSPETLLLLVFIRSWCQHQDELVFASVLRQTFMSLYSQPQAVGKELG